MVILIMKLDYFFFFDICVLCDICLKKKENIKEDEMFEVTKKSKRVIKEKKRKMKKRIV